MKLSITFFVIVCFLSSYARDNVLWKFETQDRIYASPVIDGDKLFIGSGDHSFYALDKNTGIKIWQFEAEGAIHSSAASYKGMIYFGSADGSLYALDKRNGKLIWKFNSAGEKMYDLWDYYLSSPVVDKGIIYWGCADSNLYAIDGKNGKLQWKFKTDGIVHASAVFNTENVFIGSFDGTFYALNKANGNVVWEFKTVGASYFPRGEIQKAALLKGNALYFGSRDYNIYALDAKSGRGLWNMREPLGWIIATPVEYKNYIYFGTSDAHLFYCMEKNSGEIIWKIKLAMRSYGSAAVADNIIYFGTFDGKLLGVDYLSGETKWLFQTDASKLNYGSIYTEEGVFKTGFELYGKDFEESEKMIHSLGSILSSPLIEGQIIYFGSSDGNVYAVKLK